MESANREATTASSHDIPVLLNSRGRSAAEKGRRSDAERYRQAAEAALEQVDSCITYLRRIRKHQLAARLAANSKSIRRQLR